MARDRADRHEGRTTRAFLAVEIPDHARRAVCDLCADIERLAPAGRFVKPERMHLTLHFFAALDPAQVLAVRDASRRAVLGFPRFRVVLDGLGAFPDAARARVLWMGVREGSDRLSRLASTLGGQLREAGLPVDPRPFRPHLTLARFKGQRKADLRALMGHPVVPAGFEVERVVLFRSELLPGGPRYTVLDAFPLATGEASC